MFKLFFEKKMSLQLMKKIVVGTRTMEIIGLCVSLVSCVTSLFIFCYFRTLRCHRTRIHRNLLLAIIVQVIIRLVLYIDQYIARERQSQYLAATGSYIAIFHTVHFFLGAISKVRNYLLQCLFWFVFFPYWLLSMSVLRIWLNG